MSEEQFERIYDPEKDTHLPHFALLQVLDVAQVRQIGRYPAKRGDSAVQQGRAARRRNVVPILCNRHSVEVAGQ